MSTANTGSIKTRTDGSLDLAAFWEQRLTANPSLLGVGHNGFGLAYNHWLYKMRRAVFLRHVRSLSIDFPNAQVLDVGSGIGFWLNVWRGLGVRSLTGSDITAIATQKIQRDFPGVRAVQLDITSPSALEILGTQYDVISAIDMLYHIVSDGLYASAISNLAGALKPGVIWSSPKTSCIGISPALWCRPIERSAQS